MPHAQSWMPRAESCLRRGHAFLISTDLSKPNNGMLLAAFQQKLRREGVHARASKTTRRAGPACIAPAARPSCPCAGAVVSLPLRHAPPATLQSPCKHALAMLLHRLATNEPLFSWIPLGVRISPNECEVSGPEVRLTAHELELMLFRLASYLRRWCWWRWCWGLSTPNSWQRPCRRAATLTSPVPPVPPPASSPAAAPHPGHRP